MVRWVQCYLQTAPAFGRKELDLLPHVCAAMMPAAGASQVPDTEAEITGCERVVQLMRFCLDEAAAIRAALSQGAGQSRRSASRRDTGVAPPARHAQWAGPGLARCRAQAVDTRVGERAAAVRWIRPARVEGR